MDLQKRRQIFHETYLPKYYSGFLHFLFTISLTLTGGYFSLKQVNGFGTSELVWAVFLIVYVSFSIYLSHRFQQHRRVKGLGFLFKFHTVEHHQLFDDRNMERKELNDTYMILFPPSVVLFLIFIFYPVCASFFWLLFGKNVGIVYYSVSCFYFLVYEIVHFCAHTDEQSFCYKMPILGSLCKHHRIHHNPVYMSDKNFGIVTTLWDHIFKTRISSLSES